MASTAAVICFFILVYPFHEKVVYEGSGFYQVTLNGQVLGAVAEEHMAADALQDACQDIIREEGGLVYIEPELSTVQEDRILGTRMTQQELEEAMYTVLKESMQVPEPTSYMLRVDENIMYFASEEEVLAVLEGVQNRIDVGDEFTVELVEDNEDVSGFLTTSVVSPIVEAYDAVHVFATQGGKETHLPEVGTTPGLSDGMLSVEFEQDVEVAEVYVPVEQLSIVQDAIDFLTKDKEENQVYEIVAGDCMSIIAENSDMSLSHLYDLNPGITGETILQIGQELVITVPEPELSVVAMEAVTYKEDYRAEIEYIENDSWYTTDRVVRQEAVAGYHEVSAIVSTRNGKETGRELIAETILSEAQPEIIERGTKIPPTYIWPMYSGRLTSYYGTRWGRLHAGIDLGVSTGTTVMASCGGKVISAGWNGGYGYCVLIQHPDGRKTRYGHLSKILVSVGEYVKQGEKIALSGNTGNSTGPHLHFEIIINGKAVNPLKYLK